MTYRPGRFRERSNFVGTQRLGSRYFKYEGKIYSPNNLSLEPGYGGAYQDFIERTWDVTNPGPPYKSGGFFHNYKARSPWADIQGQGLYKTAGDGTGGWITQYYEGGFVPSAFGTGAVNAVDFDNVGLSGPYGQSFGDPSAMGASAYNKFAPKTSSADAAVFLGEIREVPRMLKTTSKGFHDVWKSMGGSKTSFGPKHVADHWLNTQFGWLPFINDLRKFYSTYQNAEQKLAQLRRDNGQWVKRSGTFSTNASRSDFVSGAAGNTASVWPGALLHFDMFRHDYPGNYNKWGNTDFSTEDYSKVWFEGSFKYYLDTFSDAGATSYNEIANTLRLYGLRVSPSLVWELTPWSWLIDWGTNAGDVIDNISSRYLDNTVNKYAFIMCHKRRRAVNASTLYFTSGNVNMVWSQDIETKCRVAASPFGFGLTLDDLSMRQLSILAALGISRAR